MGRISQKHLNKVLKEYEWIIKIYRKKYSKEAKRDWRTYEQRLALRIRHAAKELLPLIKEACSQITVPQWKKILKNFIENPFPYLREYYKRNSSESGYSCDKRLSGWKVW